MLRIYNGLNRIEKIVLAILMCLLILMGFLQVIFRFVFKISLAWVEELMTFLMIWVAYLGASAATNERKHIIVNMFVDMLPSPLRVGFTIFSQILWFICSVIMTYLGWYITMNYINRGAKTLGGQFPFWAVSIAIPISFILMALRVLILISKTAKGERDVISQEEVIRKEMRS